jgi:transforming growth factor-beta-induced protein
MKTIEKVKAAVKAGIVPVVLMTSTLFVASCNKDEVEEPVMQEKNIVEVAASAGEFNILLQAATKAGLADYLSNQKGLTVFAPTDAAFQALLPEVGAKSLDDIPVETLKSILMYHVLGSKVMSNELSTGYFPTLAKAGSNNISIYVNLKSGVAINKNVKVTKPNIEASNGVIHVVDKVILPPTVVNIALDNDNFSILVQAVVKAGLVEALSGKGPFTVFAPTNDAFNALFTQLGISGVDALTAQQLTPILTYHVVSGNVLSGSLSSGEVGTLNMGKSLKVSLTGGVKINDSSVILADIQGSNGVVHVINKVLLP